MTDALQWDLGNVEDFAKAILAKNAYDYAAGGAGEERTLRDNVTAYRKWTLNPRFLVDLSKRDLSTTLLGRTHRSPIGIAPTAFHKLFHADGELGTARAAASRGMLHVVSTLSTTALEEVAVAGAPRWFQVYVHKDRALTRDLVDRAKASGYEALVLTVDAPVWGVRDRDRRNGFTLGNRIGLANFVRRLPEGVPGESSGLATYVHQQLDPSLTWSDLDWLRDVSDLPVLVKGVLSAEDARLAIEHGAAGIVVSNHGGRQLDRWPATLDVLPEIALAVDGRLPVLLDGGVRRGVDALIGLALGASFVLLGRQVVWGLAAGGQAGVERVIDLMVEELDNAMALCGRRSVSQIDRSVLRSS